MASNTSENAGRPQTHRMDRVSAGCKTLPRPRSRARASARPKDSSTAAYPSAPSFAGGAASSRDGNNSESKEPCGFPLASYDEKVYLNKLIN